MRRDVAELAGAEVAAPAAHGKARERQPERNTERGTKRTQGGGFQQHETRDAAALEA